VPVRMMVNASKVRCTYMEVVYQLQRWNWQNKGGTGKNSTERSIDSYQARGPPADADLLARQTHGEEGECPGDDGRGGGGHHAGGVPLADVAQAGDRCGDADDAREEREDDEEPRRQVADREVDREQAHRRRHALHCTYALERTDR
jgi:hypothetical protein